MACRALPPVPLPAETDTLRLGADLAAALRPGDTVLLDGELGAGKTVLARGILRALSRQPDLLVASPSYNLARTYMLPAGIALHVDLHRLAGPADCVELGLEEVWGSELALVEWPDRLGPLLPPAWIRIRIDTSRQPRRAEISVRGECGLIDRVAAALGATASGLGGGAG